MSGNIFQSWTEATSDLSTPVAAFNKLAVENMEKVAELQFASAKFYTDLGIKQLKSVAQIEDAESARAFTTGAVELAGEINKKILEDGKKLTDIGNEYKTELEDLFSKQQEKTTAKASPAKAANK